MVFGTYVRTHLKINAHDQTRCINMYMFWCNVWLLTKFKNKGLRTHTLQSLEKSTTQRERKIYFTNVTFLTDKITLLVLTADLAVTCVQPTILAPLRGLSPVVHVLRLSNFSPGISENRRDRPTVRRRKYMQYCCINLWKLDVEFGKFV